MLHANAIVLPTGLAEDSEWVQEPAQQQAHLAHHFVEAKLGSRSTFLALSFGLAFAFSLAFSLPVCCGRRCTVGAGLALQATKRTAVKVRKLRKVRGGCQTLLTMATDCSSSSSSATLPTSANKDSSTRPVWTPRIVLNVFASISSLQHTYQREALIGN